MSPTIRRLALFAGVLSVALGVGLPCLAGTGYRTQYDYPGHGDDWYGSPGLPQPRRDFPAQRLDLLLSGEDFCRGYDPFFDRLGLGPPLIRTQTAIGEYDFRFGDADPSMVCLEGAAPPDCDDGNPCTADTYDPTVGHCVSTPVADGTSCSNGVFCDGAETCQGGSCSPGTPPSCDDADPCTADSCDPLLDACVHGPPPPPAPPANLLLGNAGPDDRFVLMKWDAVAGAEAYNVYRAEVRELSDLACLLPGLANPQATDDGLVPRKGEVHYLLVTSVACGLESTLGSGAFGERENPAPCQ